MHIHGYAFAFPTYAADYTLAPTQNQNSVPDYLHLYYESGPLTIYAGEIVELDNDSEMRAAYHTRHFDYPLRFTLIKSTLLLLLLISPPWD